MEPNNHSYNPRCKTTDILQSKVMTHYSGIPAVYTIFIGKLTSLNVVSRDLRVCTENKRFCVDCIVKC